MVQQMLNQVLDAYVSKDSDLAMDVRDRDMEVDRLHTSLFREILARMSESPERVFSREQLLDMVWGHGVYVEERTVDVHMSRLRRALNKSKNAERKPDIIRTVRGTGYSLKRPGT